MITLEKAHRFFQAGQADRLSSSALVPRLAQVFLWFCAAGLCEKKFEAAVHAGQDPEYAQNVSEMMVAHRLHQAGFELRRSPPNGGPDFIAIKSGQAIQIEVVTPKASKEVSDYINRPPFSPSYTVPLEEFLMCWTKGIAAKVEQLLGGSKTVGWQEKGLVDEQLPFVIAVNGCLFAGSFDEGFREPLGGHPRAATALYAISAPTIQFDRNTGKRLWAGFELRKGLTRYNKGTIALDTFLDAAYAPVSAVWAMTLDPSDLLHDNPPVETRRSYASAVLHNPNAVVALDVGLLPAFEEWQLQPDPDGHAIALVLDHRPPRPGHDS